MGCDVGCPFIGNAFDDDRGLADPTGHSDDMFIEVIKQIGNKNKRPHRKLQYKTPEQKEEEYALKMEDL